MQTAQYPKIQCDCGYGLCQVRTSKSVNNFNRDYYVCPIKRGKKCFHWCDKVTPERIQSPPPPYQYPVCKCGAGVARREKEKNGPNAGRYYFSCAIKRGHGACGYHSWEDTLLQDSKMLKVASMETGELSDEKAELKTPSNSASYREFRITDDFHDLDNVDSESWNSIEKEAILATTPPTARCLERDFEIEKQIPIVADAPLGVSSTSSGDKEQIEEGRNERSTSQEEVCKLKMEIQGLQGTVSDIVSVLQAHFPCIPLDHVLSTPIQQAPDAASTQNVSPCGLSRS